MKRVIKKILPNRILKQLRPSRRKNTIDLHVDFTKLSTSLSDNQIYPDFCIKASTESAVFSVFRRNNVYCQILEHVSMAHGKLYLDEINRQNPELLDNMQLFRENDSYGNQDCQTIRKLGKFHLPP
jgi:hypothetical protein